MAETIFAARELQDYAARLLQQGGFTEEDAFITAGSLVRANLYGHDSHGVQRVPQYIKMLTRGELKTGVPVHYEKDGPTHALADANFALGQVQMPRILDHLLAKAETHGVVSAAVRNCGHTGRLGEWSEYIALRGHAGMVMNNDNGTVIAVAPAGAKSPRTSTNPIALGIPLGENEVFSLDMATSALALGKITVAKEAGTRLPESSVIDMNGAITTDPQGFYDGGAVLPMGGAQGYKGFALAMFIDFLTAGLSGGLTPPAGDDAAQSVSNVVITIWSPEKFAGLSHMQAQATKFIDFVRESDPLDASKPVRLPGDRARSTYQDRLKNGIPLAQGTVEKLERLTKV
jgi:uncharacterized oxidoreductase